MTTITRRPLSHLAAVAAGRTPSGNKTGAAYCADPTACPYCHGRNAREHAPSARACDDCKGTWANVRFADGTLAGYDPYPVAHGLRTRPPVVNVPAHSTAAPDTDPATLAARMASALASL